MAVSIGEQMPSFGSKPIDFSVEVFAEFLAHEETAARIWLELNWNELFWLSALTNVRLIAAERTVVMDYRMQLDSAVGFAKYEIKSC